MLKMYSFNTYDGYLNVFILYIIKHLKEENEITIMNYMVDLEEEEYLLLYKMQLINEPQNTTSLADAIGVSINTALKYLGRLDIIDFVSSKRKGKERKWTITNKGNQFIAEYMNSNVGQAWLVIWKSKDLINE
jgi:predicted transcriptional regulator